MLQLFFLIIIIFFYIFLNIQWPQLNVFEKVTPPHHILDQFSCLVAFCTFVQGETGYIYKAKHDGGDLKEL